MTQQETLLQLCNDRKWFTSLMMSCNCKFDSIHRYLFPWSGIICFVSGSKQKLRERKEIKIVFFFALIVETVDKSDKEWLIQVGWFFFLID